MYITNKRLLVRVPGVDRDLHRVIRLHIGIRDRFFVIKMNCAKFYQARIVYAKDYARDFVKFSNLIYIYFHSLYILRSNKFKPSYFSAGWSFFAVRKYRGAIYWLHFITIIFIVLSKNSSFTLEEELASNCA